MPRPSRLITPIIGQINIYKRKVGRRARQMIESPAGSRGTLPLAAQPNRHLCQRVLNVPFPMSIPSFARRFVVQKTESTPEVAPCACVGGAGARSSAGNESECNGNVIHQTNDSPHHVYFIICCQFHCRLHVHFNPSSISPFRDRSLRHNEF